MKNINGNIYTSSSECTQISEMHAIFNITLRMNFDTVICTINAIINKKLSVNAVTNITVPADMIKISKHDLEELLSAEIEACSKRAAFIFGTKYSPSNVSVQYEREE